MQRQDMGDDDSTAVSHFLNSSPVGVGRTASGLMSLDTRLLSGSLVYPSSPSSSGYHLAADRTNSLWGGSPFVHSTSIGNYPMLSASVNTTTTGLRPRSAADGGLDHHHLSYFDSYHDRPSTFHSTAGSGPSSDAYTYGVVPDSLLLRSDTSSYIPTSQLGGYLQDHSSSLLPNAPGVSNPGHIAMAPSQQRTSSDAFYSPDGLYSLGNSASQQRRESAGREANTLQPSSSFTLPGIPSAEEAFLTHIQQSTNGIADEPLSGDPRRDLLMLPSDYQQPLNFGSETNQDIARGLYHTHIGTGSPSSSESSRSSQKRAREELVVLPSVGAESSTWGLSSPAIKRQRLDNIADGFSSSVNSRSRRAQASGFPDSGPSFGSDEDADEDDFFDSGNDDSDVYVPSRSPSPVLPTVFLTSPSPPASTTGEYIPSAAKGKGGRRKGKAKGSAARALAMITKVREQQELQERVDFAYTEWSGGDGEGSSYYPLGGGVSEGEGSSNGNRSTPAQAPVPVPNLTKKSRGRKVPYVAALRGGEGIGEGIPVAGIAVMNRRGRRRAAVGGSAETTPDGFQAQAPTGDDRSFVCVVPGCGKCFVRGEHLKRHVRSIHTDDKPFLCPHKGCGKSFSRRDNLGQHVRIHLND